MAKAKKGEIRFSLAEGPQGLSVSAEGKVAWLPPQTLRGENVKASVTVKSASGQERIHYLRIYVK